MPPGSPGRPSISSRIEKRNLTSCQTCAIWWVMRFASNTFCRVPPHKGNCAANRFGHGDSISGCSVVRPTRLPWEQEIEGSNPSTQTNLTPESAKCTPAMRAGGTCERHVKATNFQINEAPTMPFLPFAAITGNRGESLVAKAPALWHRDSLDPSQGDPHPSRRPHWCFHFVPLLLSPFASRHTALVVKMTV